ncbi:hypothetical protein MauCBS54593_007084 [Microsporum audouinii]
MHAITMISEDGKFGKPGHVYYPLSLRSVPIPSPKGSELLIKLSAASLNHRDLFLRKHLYPGACFETPILSDGVGVVASTGPEVPHAQSWMNKRVVLNPATGWKDAPEGPETATGFKLMGGTSLYDKGTLQEYITLDVSEVEEAPEHLSDAEAAALPLAGLTAWRALVTKAGEANSRTGAAILVTGIGGGVALMALRFAAARGADVYVTSSSEEKIKHAIELGARGGVNYKEAGWEKKLKGMLPDGKVEFDAIIDGAGGEVVEKGVKLLKDGGIISIYGMTVGPKMTWLIQAVIKNIDLRGTTMGSRKEFKDMVDFVKEHKIKPLVWKVVQGIDNLDAINGLFDDMQKGDQFGKLVIEFGDSNGSKL